MKKFLLKTLLFSTFFIVIYLLLIIANFFAIRNLSFKIPIEKTCVVVGASQSAAAIDDNLISNVFNFSMSGDSYFNQSIRVRHLLENNPQIKTVFISVLPLNLLVKENNLGPEKLSGLMKTNIDIYYPLHSKEEFLYFWERDPWLYCKSVLSSPLRIFYAQNKIYLKELGHYRKTAATCLAHDKRALKQKNFIENKYQLKYLKKLVKTAQEHNAKIYFISCPLYNSQEYFEIDKFHAVLKKHFPTIEFWNYEDFPVPDNFRQDINHLNQWGAEIFSRELARRIEAEGLN